jgi:ABC-type multidrug transport system fused ATPase/permease subunit
MTILIIILVVSLGVNVILFITAWRKMIQIEKITEIAQEYAAKFETVNTRMQDTLEEMRSIDIRGAFEADDEVGAAFKSLEGLIEQFNDDTEKA